MIVVWFLNGKAMASVISIVTLARYKKIKYYKLEKLNIIYNKGILFVTISIYR